MKKLSTLLLILLLGFVAAGCYDSTGNAGNSNLENAVIIENTMKEVSNQLLSENKIQIVTRDGQQVCEPVPPATYVDMNNALNEALEERLGEDWGSITAEYLAELDNDNCNITEPAELSSRTLIDLTGSTSFESSNRAMAVADTGFVPYYVTGIDAWCQVRAYKVIHTVPWPTPFGFWWLYGVSRIDLSITIEEEGKEVDIVKVQLWDGNGNPYTFTIGSTLYSEDQISTENPLTASSTDFVAHFAHPALEISKWEIDFYENAVIQNWIENF